MQSRAYGHHTAGNNVIIGCVSLARIFCRWLFPSLLSSGEGSFFCAFIYMLRLISSANKVQMECKCAGHNMPTYAKICHFLVCPKNKKSRLNWANAIVTSGGGAENRTPLHDAMTRRNADRVQIECKSLFQRVHSAHEVVDIRTHVPRKRCIDVRMTEHQR